MANGEYAHLIEKIIACTACPRLIKHCQNTAREKKKAHIGESYWGRPVPPFGVSDAKLVIVGLAPAAHGANRTGRMFTGDRSGLWLYRALHRSGFANQYSYESASDGLRLNNTIITAVAKCAPPDNKPTSRETENCSQYLELELHKIYRNAKVYIALGKIAWDATLATLDPNLKPRPKFTHGSIVDLGSGRRLLGSYHPSQQNTFTKRLTEPMFDAIFAQARKFLELS